jgi:uncharacterized protein (DUF2252 family)
LRLESGAPISKKERHKQGKALREKCPRTEHAEWKPRSKSQDIIKLLEESDADRIPGLIPLRYERMSESPFKFFRGTAIIQAQDLASSPVSGIKVQLCGDCHLMNFGAYASPERNLVFDINDLDETFPGPWEWDVKRLGTSLVLAARDNGFSKQIGKDAVRAAVPTYRERMSVFAGWTELERWYAQVKIEDILDYFREDRDFLDRLKRKQKAARSASSEAAFPKLTAVVDGRRRIKDNPPVIYHFQENVQDFHKQQKQFWEEYRKSLQWDRRQLVDRYRWQDGAIKVVGVGSVGTRCFVALFLADEDDPLFLQIKEARRSVLESPKGKSRFAQQGIRVVDGVRLMQASSDIFLGWGRGSRHDFYIRQFRDMKVSAEPETFKPSSLVAYATLCGWTLARAHAKAGDAARIAGYLGNKDTFDKALVKYSEAYADQAERDFGAFKAAIRSGRLRTKPAKASGLEFLI